MIRFVEIDEDNFQQAISLKVSQEQSSIIASNLYSLAQAYVLKDFARPFIIYNDEIAVGFIIFIVDLEEPEFYIWRIMIAEEFQGEGFGKLAMLKAMEYLKSLGAKKIELSHRVDNPKPGKLYESLGFVYTGEIDDKERMMIYKFNNE